MVLVVYYSVPSTTDDSAYVTSHLGCLDIGLFSYLISEIFHLKVTVYSLLMNYSYQIFGGFGLKI